MKSIYNLVKMLKWNKLTEYEEGIVDSFELSGVSCRSIGKNIGIIEIDIKNLLGWKYLYGITQTKIFGTQIWKEILKIWIEMEMIKEFPRNGKYWST